MMRKHNIPNLLVLDWPKNKKLPVPGDKIDAGELGEAFVESTMTSQGASTVRKFRTLKVQRVTMRFFERIET